jgi:tRNA threonylcarbamoyladenosine biosynthesis protein TsaE
MELASAEETETFGATLAGSLRAGDVVALEGELGTGKTTLARGIAKGLGFEGEVSSPTFPIVQMYEGEGMRLPLWHVDLYRVENRSEIAELGLEEAREGAVLVIEWPDRLGTDLWPETLRLQLRPGKDGARALTAQVPPAWEGRWPLR